MTTSPFVPIGILGSNIFLISLPQIMIPTYVENELGYNEWIVSVMFMAGFLGGVIGLYAFGILSEMYGFVRSCKLCFMINFIGLLFPIIFPENVVINIVSRLVIGTSAGSLLPKAGAWMDSIKAVFGVLMLGLSIWLLERIIPGWVALLLWGSLFIVSAIYLGALNTLTLSSNSYEKLSKGVGIIILIYGALLIIGGASGNQNVWQPLQGITSASNPIGQSQQGAKFKQIANLAELEQAIAQSNQPVMLDLYADWCVECKTMEMTTFHDPTVVATLANLTLLQLDMTDNNDEHKALLKQFGIFGPPTILFFDPQGSEYEQHRLIGTLNASDFNAHITAVLAIE